MSRKHPEVGGVLSRGGDDLLNTSSPVMHEQEYACWWLDSPVWCPASPLTMFDYLWSMKFQQFIDFRR